MGGEILPQEVTEFSRKHRNSKVYHLEVDEVSLGFFYVSPDICTLNWQGVLNFFLLDWEALEALPSSIMPGWKREFAFTETETDLEVVNLILRSQELKEYNLLNEKEFFQYKAILQRPDMVSFIRYDVSHTLKPFDLDFSFTVENPNWSPTHKSELAIRLPKRQPWRKELLEWVIGHHVAASVLQKRGIKLQDLTHILTDLSRSF